MSAISAPNDISREFEATMQRGSITKERLEECQTWWLLNGYKYEGLQAFIQDRIYQMARYVTE